MKNFHVVSLIFLSIPPVSTCISNLQVIHTFGNCLLINRTNYVPDIQFLLVPGLSVAILWYFVPAKFQISFHSKAGQVT